MRMKKRSTNRMLECTLALFLALMVWARCPGLHMSQAPLKHCTVPRLSGTSIFLCWRVGRVVLYRNTESKLRGCTGLKIATTFR